MLRRSTETLSEIFGAGIRRKDLFDTTVNDALPKHSTYYQDSDSLSLPILIEPARHNLEEFFIQVATYYSSRSPITAFSRVLDQECAGYFRATLNSQDSRFEIPRNAILGALGAAVGETYLATLSGSANVAVPSYASCRRSLSFVLARGRRVHSSINLAYLSQKWARLRQLTRLPISEQAMESVLQAHAFLFQTDFEEKAVAELIEAGLWSRMARDPFAFRDMLYRTFPKVVSFDRELDGPFDARMKAFTSLAHAIAATSKGATLDNLALGYFANRIQPGSFSHANVLAKLRDFFPTALIWYGMFCVLSPEFDIRDFSFSMVAKLLRDVHEPFSFQERPTCDLSFEELEVLIRLPTNIDLVKPIQQKIALIELMPGVSVSSRFFRDDDSEVDAVREYEDFKAQTGELKFLLETALAIVSSNRSQSEVPASTKRRARTRK